MTKGPPTEGWDIILMTPRGGDSIWIRSSEQPIQFMANLNSFTVFTGTCEALG